MRIKTCLIFEDFTVEAVIVDIDRQCLVSNDSNFIKNSLPAYHHNYYLALALHDNVLYSVDAHITYNACGC
jgi:hypothetical protein